MTGSYDERPALGIMPEEIIAANRVLLLGDSGSGKSTLLRSIVPLGGVLVHARDLVPPGSLTARVSSSVEAGAARDLRSTENILLVDGFDEVPRHRQNELGDVIATALADRDVARIVVATRAVPAAASLRRVLTIRQVPALDRSGAAQILAALVPSSSRPDRVVNAMHAASRGNPLLLVLLAQQYVDRGQIARGRIGILKLTVDSCIASVVESSDPALSRESVRDAYAQIALDVLLTEAAQTTEERIVAALSPLLGSAASDYVLACLGTEPSTFLYRTATGMVRFQHRLVAEFTAALALHDDREMLATLAERGHANDAIGFALHLSDQPAACLVAVGRRVGIDSVARLGPHLAALDSDVLETARTALVGELREALPAPDPASVEPDEPGAAVTSWPVKLADRWRQVQESDARGTARGDELEHFMADFFGEFFNVVEHKYKTKHGEIDLVLEIARREPFWAEHGPDICVECKNWQEPVGQEEILKVLAGRRKSRFKLAFIVSRAGFTRDALEEIRSASEDPRDLLVVPIAGDQISQTLADGEDPESFFTDIVRHRMHGRAG